MSMNTNTKPPILEGCAVLPPMHQGNGSPRRHQGDTSKAKGKPGRRNTADRFAVLNGFVDAGMVSLSRVEIGTWLTLYRDTRNGTACRVDRRQGKTPNGTRHHGQGWNRPDCDYRPDLHGEVSGWLGDRQGSGDRLPG